MNAKLKDFLDERIKRLAATVPTWAEAKRDFERQYLTQVLEITMGNVAAAARLAGKDRRDFYDAMRKHGLEPGAFRGGA